MKLLVLCREPRLYSCKRLKQAAENRGYELDILDPNRFILTLEDHGSECYYQYGESYDKSRSQPIRLPNYVGVIGRFGSSSTVMGCTVLRHFSLNGTPLLNSAEAFELARDKWRSLQSLKSQGLPVPKTGFGGELVESSALLNDYSFPVVIKTLQGAQGIGVMLSESYVSAKSLLDTLHQNNIAILTQQFHPEATGQDIRAFVIGSQVVAAMLRKGKHGEFRANIHQGGSAENVMLTPEEQLLAVQAARAIGLEVAGVDLIRSTKGTLVLEVNASPGLEMIEQVSREPIAEMMIDYLVDKIRS